MELWQSTWQQKIWLEVPNMKKNIKKWLRPVLFTFGGALVGLGYYSLVGCSTGSCLITSNPLVSMAYMGLIGWLLSDALGTGCKDTYNM